jgi:hypothetical protein
MLIEPIVMLIFLRSNIAPDDCYCIRDHSTYTIKELVYETSGFGSDSCDVKFKRAGRTASSKVNRA